jgi:hypothetical protein
LRYDTDFHNIIIADLFKCMCVNRTLHIVHTVVTNEYVNNKVGCVVATNGLGCVVAACAKNNNK